MEGRRDGSNQSAMLFLLPSTTESSCVLMTRAAPPEEEGYNPGPTMLGMKVMFAFSDYN